MCDGTTDVAISWTTQTRKVKELRDHTKNPRSISKDQMAQLKSSLEKFNYAELIAINADNTILSGHMRVKALKSLGRGKNEIEVRVASRLLSEKEADEYLIRSNKNSGDWDWDKLANEFEVPDLIDWGFSIDDLGIDTSSDDDPAGSDTIDLVVKFRVSVGSAESTEFEDQLSTLVSHFNTVKVKK